MRAQIAVCYNYFYNVVICSSEPRGQRLGYMGHLIRIVNLILQCGEADQNLAQILKDAMEGDVQKKWNDFIAGTVADTNKKNETNLVSSWK